MYIDDMSLTPSESEGNICRASKLVNAVHMLLAWRISCRKNDVKYLCRPLIRNNKHNEILMVFLADF